MSAPRHDGGDRLDRRNLLRNSGMGALALGALAGGGTLLSGVRPAEGCITEYMLRTPAMVGAACSSFSLPVSTSRPYASKSAIIHPGTVMTRYCNWNLVRPKP